MSNIQCSIMETPSRTSLLFDLAWAAAAFVFWGGWACYANLEAGLSVGIVSGLAQGAFSFAMTLLMVKAITMIYNRLHGHRFRYLLPAVATIACSGTLLAVTHLLAGTPNILATISPPLVIAFFFCMYTVRQLESAASQGCKASTPRG